ncbi:armadillo-type protein [Scheffersomyces coipomensis]|uniref:armadillo-type protein n=1 Tax=Scheffersomyces coipomensis TaxID=1788519 RepID=UPI00315D221A
MSTFNINALKDKSLDVDPDLRFMALEDFRKGLPAEKANTPNQAIEAFIPVLFRLLKDENSYVQNSAVKSFEPIIGFISDKALIKMVQGLFSLAVIDQSDSTRGLKSFTTSIPTMTLKSLLNSPILLDKKDVCRKIMEFVLPKTKELSVTIDVVEILADLTKNLSYVLVKDEIYNLLVYLLDLIVNHKGIISKRSIASFEYLFKYVKDSDIKTKILTLIQRVSDVLVKFQLYSIAFKNKVSVNDKLVQDVFGEVVQALDINQSSIDLDDFDYDSLVELNIIREQSLTLLADMLDILTPFYDKVFDIIFHFLSFNPLQRDDLDTFIDSDDDIDFEDEEEIEDNFGDDDNSWKLRLKSCEILQLCISESSLFFPKLSQSLVSKIPVDDTNDLVSNEALKTFISIASTFSTSDDERFTYIKSRVSGILQIKSKIGQFPTLFALIKEMNRFQDGTIISDTFSSFKSLTINSRGASEYLSFYNSVLDTYVREGALSNSTVDFMANDLISALDEKGISVLTEIMRTLKKLLKNPNSIFICNDLVVELKVALLSKVSNARTYSSDFIQNCIDVVAVLATTIVKNDVEIVDVLWNCLSNEILSKTSLEALLVIYSSESTISGAISLSELSRLISKGDESTYILALDLAYLVIPKTTLSTDDIIDVILRRKGENDIGRIFAVLNLIFVQGRMSPKYLQEIIEFSISLVNSGTIKIDDNSFFEFIGNVSRAQSDLFFDLSQHLNFNLESSSKALAIVCVGAQLNNEIEKAEQLFLQQADSFLFSIQFLGYVGKYIPFKNISALDFFKLLNNVNDEATKEAIAVAIGNFTLKNITEGLDILLENFSATDSKNSIFLITSFRLILPDCTKEQLESIWKKVWSETKKLPFDHSVCLQLRSIGDLLGDIVVQHNVLVYSILEKYGDNTISEFNFTEIYTISVVLKQLINKLDNSEESLSILEKLIRISAYWTDLLSIDIRQLVIGNFLTALHTIPSIVLCHLQSLILPQLYKQLSAEEKFKKIISMGPSKYILDEGLEIRKLTYEFLYALLSFANETLTQYNISLYEIGINIVNKGLKDEQVDIIVLACINIINFLNNHEQEFVDIILSGDGEILISIIGSLKKSLDKKLSDKASSQETENHQERMKAVTKSSKRLARSIDTLQCILPPAAELAWSEYIVNLKTKYSIYYMSSEDDYSK